MSYNEVLEALRAHALKFHKALVKGKIYTTNLKKEEFFDRICAELSGTARYIVEHNGDLELHKLNLPVSLRNELEDVLAYANWDYEACYDGFFDDLTRLFSRSAHAFKWEYDPGSSQLIYALDGHSWTIDNLRLRAEVDFEVYEKIMSPLNDALKEHGQVLYDAVTGDQTGLLILMPSASPGIIKDFFIEVHDPRAEIFYEGGEWERKNV